MHSTLRRELRGTQRILKFASTRPTSQPRSRFRPFSQGHPRSDETKPSNNRSNLTSEQSGGQNKHAVTSSSSRASELGLEIERWINHLSEHGKSLKVWDTISERDESGRWRLLPQARTDLEDVHKWAKSRHLATNQPFGIKVAEGRIRAVSTQDMRPGQEDGMSAELTHSLFLSESDSQRISKIEQTQERSGVLANGQLESIEARPHDESESRTQSRHLDSSLVSMTEAPKFYGSAAARRQRAQLMKDKTSEYVLPNWFSTQNISRRNRRDSKADTVPIRMSNGTSATGSRDGIVLWHPEEAQISSSSHNKDSATQLQSDSLDESAQVLSTGGDAEPSGGDASDQAHANSGSSISSPIFVPLPDNDKTYYIEEAQHNELLATAKGRLRSPASGSLDNRPGGIRGHLIIHYAAADGELFLDHLVEDMAKRLDCNLIALDAQDISSLIVGADVDSMVKEGASVLGYDIYGEIYKDDMEDQSAAQPNSSEEQEDADEDFGAPTAQGMPFVVGKPITIDLKALFSSKPHRKPSGLRPSNIMPDIFGSSSTKPNNPLFAAIVDSILSSANRQESDTKTADKRDHQDRPQSDKYSEGDRSSRTIMHIKELRSIQDTNIGKQFLTQLYEQVERRRANGESIMLIGTECSRDDRASYDQARINSLQSGEQEEISSTLVVTPVEAQGKDVLLADRSRRLQIINARHLWQMLQSKNITLNALQPSIWQGNSSTSIHAADGSYLEKKLWSFGYVQRLAAILASSDLTTSEHPIAEAAAVIELSDNSKFTWAQQGRKDGTGDTKSPISERADRIAKIREKANKHEKRLLGGVIEPKKISTTFEDIHIPKDTVESLQTLTTLSLVRPDAFQYGVLASDRIPGLLLYGPPGTGKTLAAKAVARESGATMLEVSSADINDMYVGEGEKNVKALFSLAKKLSPCVVFLDEADAMFSARSAHGRRVSHRELLNQFLREWDGMSNDSGSAFIMVATNRPMDLDDAVLRRLPRRLLIDLPTEKDRLEILKIHLKHEQLAGDVNLTQLATKTPFYSGSDLKNLAVSAALNAVREETAKAKKCEGEKADYPAKRTLTAHDFEKALEEIGASISEDMSSLRDIKKFDEQYGDRKGRKRKSPRWGFKTSAEADAVLDTIKVRT